MENQYIHFPNFELFEIESEMSMIKSYLDLVEEHLSMSIEQERLVAQEKIRLYNINVHDDEWSAMRQELDYLMEYYLPRILRGPFIVSLWSVLESALFHMANLLRVKRQTVLSMYDLGGGIIKQARNYFDHILDFRFCDGATWGRLAELYDVRCGFAHSNGNIELMRDVSKRKKLAKYCASHKDLEVVYDCIVPSRKYISNQYELVHSVISRMLDQYKKAYPS